jgi:XTP/dITP diphosphohydrolase
LKSLLIATHNPGKLKEFHQLLGKQFKCETAPADWPTPHESGSNYFENAEIKARSLYDFCGRSVLSDDSGVEIDALGGEPGLHSATFGGESLSWSERWNYVYSRVSQIPEERWTARFRCILCYFDGGKPQFFEGITEGRLVPAPRGDKGFGYDPIFFCTVLGKTFGEASAAEKQKASHRAFAAQKFLEWGVSNLS